MSLSSPTDGKHDDVALKKLSFSRYTDDRPGHFPDADWDVPVRDDWKLPASL